MNMQQMMIQAQKMQRELQKMKDELAQKEFSISKNGAVTVVVMGDKTIKTINIEKDALEPDNKEMIEELIALAINEAVSQIKAAEAEISSQVTGGAGLF